MILNGVCVIWKGWIDLQRLDGMGCLEYDDERAQVQINHLVSSNCLKCASEMTDRRLASCLFVCLYSRRMLSPKQPLRKPAEGLVILRTGIARTVRTWR